MEDNSDEVKDVCFFIAAIIVGIGYFFRPEETNFFYYLKISFAAMTIATIGVMIASFDAKRTQRKREKQAARILSDLKRTHPKNRNAYLLYLRPFFSTGNLPVERPHGGFLSSLPIMRGYFDEKVDEKAVELEKTVANALHPFGLLIGLGKPGEQVGAARVVSDERAWRSDVELLVKYAEFLILIPSERHGTSWEISLVRDEGFLEKCVFLMPPALYFSKIDIESVWAATSKSLQKIGFKLPPYNSKGMMFTLNENGLVKNKLPLNLHAEDQLMSHISTLLKLPTKK